MIRICGLSKKYRIRAKRALVGDNKKTYRNAVDGIEIKIPEKCVFTILGSNGSGKTTTMRMLTTVLKPTEGTIIYDDLEGIEHTTDIRKKIVFIPQFSVTQSDLTVYENIYYYYYLRQYSMSDARKKAKKVLEEYDLIQYKDEKVRSLSGGYRRRIEVGRGLEDDAKYVFMDEPTTGLDPQTRRLVWRKVIEAKEKGKTIVLTTQIMEEAEALADYIAFLKKGKLLTTMSVDDAKRIFAKNYVSISYEESCNISIFLNYKIITWDKDKNSIELDIGDNDEWDVLKELMELGLKVRGFYKNNPTIEDIYFELEGGEPCK